MIKLARLKRALLVLLIASACATPTPAPTPTLTPYPTDPPTDVFCPQPSNWIAYVVKPGDTIRSLAERTSSAVGVLELANCLNNPSGALRAGQVFYLPRPPITP